MDGTAAKKAKAEKPTKAKKRKGEQDEQPPEAAPKPDSVEEAPKKKAKKPKTPKEPKEAPPEVEVDEDDDEGEETPAQRTKKENRKKRISGYRAKARECGYGKAGGVVVSSGVDAHRSLLSETDARKLIGFLPDNLGCDWYSQQEFALRMKAGRELVSGAAAREAQARLDAVMRSFMNDAMLRTVEAGKSTVTTATMHATLRKYGLNMMFTGVLPPRGLLKHAQEATVLAASAEDDEAKTAHDEEAAANAAENEKLKKERDELKAARKKRREEQAGVRPKSAKSKAKA